MGKNESVYKNCTHTQSELYKILNKTDRVIVSIQGNVGCTQYVRKSKIKFKTKIPVYAREIIIVCVFYFPV